MRSGVGTPVESTGLLKPEMAEESQRQRSVQRVSIARLP